MLVVYHEAFSDRYLITLIPSDTPEDAGLAAHLDRAYRSSKIAVWIDCRLVRTLSTTVTRLLRTCQYHMRHREARLVLCNASADVEQELRQVFSPADLCLAPTLNAPLNHLEVGCGPEPS